MAPSSISSSRGLAGAVRTDDTDPLAGVDGEVDAVDRLHVAEPLPDAASGDDILVARVRVPLLPIDHPIRLAR